MLSKELKRNCESIFFSNFFDGIPIEMIAQLIKGQVLDFFFFTSVHEFSNQLEQVLRKNHPIRNKQTKLVKLVPIG